MAEVLAVMNGGPGFHPFFARIEPEHVANDTEIQKQIPSVNGVHDQLQRQPIEGRKRRSKRTLQSVGKKQKTLLDVLNGNANGNAEASDVERTPEEKAESLASSADASPPRPKRRRTSEDEYVQIDAEREASLHSDDGAAKVKPGRSGSPQVVIPVSSALPSLVAETRALAPKKTPPKKMLRLSANGKFSSPVQAKAKDEQASGEAPARRGRPRKSKDVQALKHLIAKLKYGAESGTGHKIDLILSGQERHAAKIVPSTPKKQRTPRKPRPRKATHPFFLDKPKDDEPSVKPPSPQKASAVTPGKLRRQFQASRSLDKTLAPAGPEYVVGSELLKDRLMLKHPGATEVPFPSQGLNHLRGLSASDEEALRELSVVESHFSRRKRKTAHIPFPIQHSLLHRFAVRLEPEIEGSMRNDGFREPHPSLKLPKKLLITGKELAQRVVCELQVRKRNASKDEFHDTQHYCHTAVQRLLDRLPNGLSAFDEGRGENHAWTQKYEPLDTMGILQPTQKMNVLKEWLTSLTVNSVHNANSAGLKMSQKPDVRPRKKRWRKDDEMDGFLVDDDDDIREMDEIADPEDPPMSSGASRTGKSMVQIVSNGLRLSNAILLSGPSGCGKTAAAHAVARELGFKVFEISPCERRNGKDVLEKVGDMTENHLVKHHGPDAGDLSSAEEPSRNEEAFQRDLASGRQGKMNAFFKPKAGTAKASPRRKAIQKRVVEAVQQATKKPPKDQQQSLILLEEVDILFKDDKDFWNTIFKLMESSKRPFIMTCNDEDLVPLQAISLHAILRFAAPSTDLATDYLLAMAANEGHLLSRDAVASLYRSKHLDLRATIAELDFWCQMSVGDPRGGLAWILQRYPPGAHLDGAGQKIRVVSQHTYTALTGRMDDESLGTDLRLLPHCREYGLSAFDILDSDYCLPGELPSLKQFSRAADFRSAADLYGGQRACDQFDTTQPPLEDKLRLQYSEGLPLLHVDERVNYASVAQELAIATALAIRPCYVTGSSQEDIPQLVAGKPLRDATGVVPLTRHNFACLDTLATPSETALFVQPGLFKSVIDGPLKDIAVDIAPFVRSIVNYDLALAEYRDRLGMLTSESRHAKPARTTRAARSALEGGARASTRREKWFSKRLDMEAVLATGGSTWPKTGLGSDFEGRASSQADGSEAPTSSAGSNV